MEHIRAGLPEAGRLMSLNAVTPSLVKGYGQSGRAIRQKECIGNCVRCVLSLSYFIVWLPAADDANLACLAERAVVYHNHFSGGAIPHRDSHPTHGCPSLEASRLQVLRHCQ